MPISPHADPDKLAQELAGLGYPGFAHLPRSLKANPAAVLLEALIQPDLEVRLVEALPWVVLEKHSDVDWAWLVPEVARRDAQNRLGFIVAMAREFATGRVQFQEALEQLCSVQQALERVRLDKEDTLCRASMPAAEREWLATARGALAAHWNLITGLTPEQLPYSAMPSAPAQARNAKIIWPDVDLIDERDPISHQTQPKP